MLETQQLQVNYIDPGLILADDNARFGLKETRIETMVDSIRQQGGVRTPLKVSELPKPIDGKLYRVNEGHYRLEASMRLKTDRAFGGMEVPVEVEPQPDALVRLKRQLSENMDRENLSPMDTAVAIKKLVEAQVPKMEIRKIFTRPGGRKGLKNQPASNSFLNMHLQFLEFTKNIQEKIHDGRITVGGALELTRHPREKWGEIVEELEQDRLRAIEAEEKMEAKILEEERKVIAAREKAEEVAKEADKAIKESTAVAELLTQAEADIKTNSDAAMTAYKERHAVKGDKARAQTAQEALKAAEDALKASQTKAEALRKEVAKKQAAADKQKEALEKAQKAADDKEAALKASREMKMKKKAEKQEGRDKAAGSSAVKTAAQKVTGTGTEALKLADLRELLKAVAGCGYPKVKAIGSALVSAADGVGTPTSTIKQLATITGEYAKPAAK